MFIATGSVEYMVDRHVWHCLSHGKLRMRRVKIKHVQSLFPPTTDIEGQSTAPYILDLWQILAKIVICYIVYDQLYLSHIAVQIIIIINLSVYKSMENVINELNLQSVKGQIL